MLVTNTLSAGDLAKSLSNIDPLTIMNIENMTLNSFQSRGYKSNLSWSRNNKRVA